MEQQSAIFRALIVDNAAASRSYLWEAVLADPHFRNVTASKALDEAQAMFLGQFETDVVLISSSFDIERMKLFIESIRQTEGGREAAMVAIVRPTEQENASLGRLLALGVDGFILTPFSVHSVGEVAEIAKRVKREFDRRRKRAAARLLSVDLLLTFDDANRKLFMVGNSQGKLRETLKEIHAQIEEIVTGEPDLGFEAVREQARGMEAPRKSLYQGPSQRLKKKMAND